MGVLRGQLGTNVILNLWDQGKAAAEQREMSVKAGDVQGKDKREPDAAWCQNLVPKSGVHIWAGSEDVRKGKMPVSGAKRPSPGLG